MAVIEKNFLDLPGLTTYDTNIKEYISSAAGYIPTYNSQTETLELTPAISSESNNSNND